MEARIEFHPVAEEAVTLEDVIAASERVKPLARHTPIYTSRLFNEAARTEAFFKCENLQRGGAFKIRGATNFIASLSEAERKRGVVTFSSGNHAQAVAIAAAHFGVAATIVMPTDAPKAKLESTKLYNPKIVFFDRQRENRETIAQKIASETGAIILPSYDHPWIIAGQGTTGLEMLREKPDLDAIVVPLGGGGLLSGTLVAAKALRPRTRLFGVEPELANDWYLSLRAGKPVEIAPPATIADGLRTPVPGNVTFPIIRSTSNHAGIEDVLLVSEEEIKATMRFLLMRMKILVEPSGAVAAAAVLHRKLPSDISSAGVILSGGNVDLDLLSEICGAA
jgi:threonine dehydratase